MDNTYAYLASYLVEKILSLDPNERFLLGIAGIPGSGKSTLALKVISLINQKMENVSAMIPMDGFHYPKYVLDTFEARTIHDAEQAHARRGSYWTFDAEGLLELLKTLRQPIDPENPNVVKAPSFEHAIGDPIKDDISILPSHKLVIFEGLYLLLTEPHPWDQIQKYMNELWFIDVEIPIAKDRVILRHLASGIAKHKEEAAQRFENNDKPNAEYILAHRAPPTRIIYSVEDQEEVQKMINEI
ncbi:9152_t:CDS:2 [Ambispora leptoticha]|uniref:9152_t:CDS:1 n=1 Tax=Ambispora leptoticha TaxID=144679 RepID=A0A9N9B903_9GLOM|nr:9152_t:CDS:2 [Ambispora leptoticha]